MDRRLKHITKYSILILSCWLKLEVLGSVVVVLVVVTTVPFFSRVVDFNEIFEVSFVGSSSLSEDWLTAHMVNDAIVPRIVSPTAVAMILEV